LAVPHKDAAEQLEDPEAWAREHVRLDAAQVTGKYAITWIARLDVEGLIFEHRERGDFRKRRALRQRATEAVITEFLEWLGRTKSRNDGAGCS